MEINIKSYKKLFISSFVINFLMLIVLIVDFSLKPKETPIETRISQETSSYSANIEKKNKELEQQKELLVKLQKQVEDAKKDVANTDLSCFYSLEREIFLVKFRTQEQKEIWIKKNNENANFSEELIEWLRSRDTFYVSETLNKLFGKIKVDSDSFIFLPPCPACIQDGSQPITYKTRLSVIRRVTKEEYLENSGI